MVSLITRILDCLSYQKKARKGRNPRTGEEIKIKAKKVPKFLPGKGLKDAV